PNQASQRQEPAMSGPSGIPPAIVTHADLCAARDAVVRIVRCISRNINPVLSELTNNPGTDPSLLRMHLAVVVRELEVSIPTAEAKLASVRDELDAVCVRLPSAHEEVVVFAREFRSAAKSLLGTTEVEGIWAQRWLTRVKFQIDAFEAGIDLNPRAEY